MKTEAYPRKRLTKKEQKELRKYLDDADDNILSESHNIDEEANYTLEDEQELPSDIDYRRLNNSDFSTEDE